MDLYLLECEIDWDGVSPMGVFSSPGLAEAAVKITWKARWKSGPESGYLPGPRGSAVSYVWTKIRLDEPFGS